MNNTSKKSVFNAVLAALVLLFAVLTALFAVVLNKNANLEKQVKSQNETINDLIDRVDEYENDYVFITVINTNGTASVYKSYIDLELSIMEVLLINGYLQNDFTSYDKENFFFADVLTDVIELKGNPEFYEDNEYGGTLLVGLNNIPANREYTIVRTRW